MKSTPIFTVASFALVTMLLTLGVGSVFAADGPMPPELAAKGQRVKTQQTQKITQAQRKAAAETLKAERLKLYQKQHGSAQPTETAPVAQ